MDAGRKRIVKEWGLLVPMRSEEHWIADYDAVVLRFEEGDSDTADKWPVVLRARSGLDLVLSTETDFALALRRAEEAAGYLGFPLVDASTRRVSETAPGQGSAPLRERLRSGDEEVEPFPRPPRPRSQVREHRDGAQIAIPGPAFPRSWLVMLAVSGGVLAWFAPGLIRFFTETNTPGAVQTAAFAFLGLFFAVVPMLGALNDFLRSVRGGTVVTVSAEGMVIEERGAWRSRFTRVAAADILGLDHGTTDEALAEARAATAARIERSGRTPPRLAGGREPGWARALRALVPSRGVIVKARSGLVPFGAGLPDDEVRWLHGVVGRALGSGGER